MTYQELVAKAKEMYECVDAGSIQGHIAYQFNITGEGEGAFYLEVSNGRIHVEPYEYYDRDAIITTTAENLLKIAAAELDPVHAYLTGQIKVQGDLKKAELLRDISVKAAEMTQKVEVVEIPVVEQENIPAEAESVLEVVEVTREHADKATEAKGLEETKEETPVKENITDDKGEETSVEEKLPEVKEETPDVEDSVKIEEETQTIAKTEPEPTKEKTEVPEPIKEKTVEAEPENDGKKDAETPDPKTKEQTTVSNSTITKTPARKRAAKKASSNSQKTRKK